MRKKKHLCQNKRNAIVVWFAFLTYVEYSLDISPASSCFVRTYHKTPFQIPYRVVLPFPAPQAACHFIEPRTLLISFCCQGLGVWGRELLYIDVSSPFLGGRQKMVPDSLIEDALQVSLGQCATLQVLVGPNLFSNDQSLVIRDWLHSLLLQALQGVGVFSQIQLGTNEDDGNRGCMMPGFLLVRCLCKSR